MPNKEITARSGQGNPRQRQAGQWVEVEVDEGVGPDAEEKKDEKKSSSKK